MLKKRFTRAVIYILKFKLFKVFGLIRIPFLNFKDLWLSISLFVLDAPNLVLEKPVGVCHLD